jgi:hypothetical protein
VRIVEAPVTAYSFDSKAETDAFGQLLMGNYGHACVPYMQFLMQRGDEAKQLFLSMQERIDKAAGLSQPHRFWSAQAASAMAGAVIAKKAGLINYDIPTLFKWIVGILILNKLDYVEADTSAEEILTTFLAENYNNILRIKSTEDARTASDSDICIIPDNAPRFQFVARYEYDIKRLYLIPKVFREWCSKQQIAYGDTVEELKEGRTKAHLKKQRLGKGTRMNLPPMDVLVLNCADFLIDLPTDNGEVRT